MCDIFVVYKVYNNAVTYIVMGRQRRVSSVVHKPME